MKTRRCRVVRVSATLVAALFMAMVAVLPLAGGVVRAAELADVIRPVTARDHVRGARQAPVKIIEYSDTECPLCKRQHAVLQQILRNYPDRVAWVYRHRPIARIHPKALKEAEAAECAGELGGPAAFWTFLDRLFEVTPSNNRLDRSELPRIAIHAGLDRERFRQCLDSGRHAARVAADAAEMEAGDYGAPFSVVVAPNGRMYTMAGAHPYETWDLVVEIALREQAP